MLRWWILFLVWWLGMRGDGTEFFATDEWGGWDEERQRAAGDARRG